MPTKKPTDNAIILGAVTELSKELSRMESETRSQHAEKMAELAEIKVQVKTTNGRVTTLEKRMDSQDAVEKYKQQVAQQPVAAVKVETTNTWDWKTVLAILLTLATAIAGVVAGISK